jgi:hypothetical protein
VTAALTSNCIASFNVLQNDLRRLALIRRPANFRLLAAPNNFNVGDGLNTRGFHLQRRTARSAGGFLTSRSTTSSTSGTMSSFVTRGAAEHGQRYDQQRRAALSGACAGVNTERTPNNLAVSYRRVISNNLVNELVGGFNRFTFNFINPLGGDEPFSIVTVNRERSARFFDRQPANGDLRPSWSTI